MLPAPSLTRQSVLSFLLRLRAAVLVMASVWLLFVIFYLFLIAIPPVLSGQIGQEARRPAGQQASQKGGFNLWLYLGLVVGWSGFV